MENRYVINYDIKQRAITNIKFKQGDIDSSVLEVHLIDNGLAIDITGETIEFRFLKPDSTIVFQDITAGVTIKDAIKGYVECALMSNTLAKAGDVKCEIHRALSGKELTTPSFIFKVEESIGANGVASTNYISSVESKIIEWQNNVAAIETSYAPRLTTVESDLAGIPNQINSAVTLKADLSYVDTKFGSMGSTKTFKGSCLFASLPSTGMAVDDYWYVSDADKLTNYCYNGTSWVDIGNNLKIGDYSVTPDMLTDAKTETVSGNFVSLIDSIEAKLRGLTFDAITGTPTSVKIYACKKNLANILYQSATQNTVSATMVQIEKSVIKKGKTYTISFDTVNTGYTCWLKWNTTQMWFAMDGTHKTFTLTETADWTTNSALIAINTTSAGNCGAITNLMLVEGDAEAPYESYQGANITVTGSTLVDLNNAVSTLYSSIKAYKDNTFLWCQDATTLITVTYAKSINSIGQYDDTSIQDFIRNSFKGKKWVSYGDSLTKAGNNLENPSYQYFVHNYFEFLNHVGAGVGGSKISHLGTMNMYVVTATGLWDGGDVIGGSSTPDGTTSIPAAFCSWARINLQIPSDADLIFVFGGANDCESSYSFLEGYTQTVDAPTDLDWKANAVTDLAWSNSEHYSKYNGDYNIYFFKNAIASMIMKLQCKAPNALIVFANLIKTKGVTGANYVTNDNPSGYDEKRWADATIDVCRSLGIPCIDLYGTSGINNLNRATYVADVIHPNAEGRKLLGRAIVSGLKPILGKYV